jgi:Activator of Hsp90 ATPase homolog 1-like protein
MSSYTTTFSVKQTPTEVFDAITNVRGWWSEEVDGGTARPGDEFTYRYEDKHRCRIRVTEAVAGRKVTWLVLDNYFDFTKDQTEWNDTAMSFEISASDGGTVVRFTHVGLVAEYECFDACSNAWSFYINGSLRSLITTGSGAPNGRGRPRIPAEALS